MGRKALQEAEKRAENFLNKNKYGLYRGEVLLDIGTAYLVSFFDTENGEKWLTRAAEWFDNVQQFDKDLKDFELPESVRKVSQPPKNERFTDRWNNVKMSKPKPGNFFNRRSCSWYWNAKRKDVTLLQGLIAFAKENYEAAEKHWNLLAELDKEFYAQQKAAGWENATTLARLTWAIHNKKGSFYATSEEIASFKDPKRRSAILIADLFYESEQQQRALSIYQRLENRELGTLSKNELAYVIYGEFACLCWDPKFNENQYLKSKWKYLQNTFSEKRALAGYARRLGNNQLNIFVLEEKLRIRQEVRTRFPDSIEAADFLYFMGWDCSNVVKDFLFLNEVIQNNGVEKISKEKMTEYLLIKQKIDFIIEKGLTFYEEYCKKYENGTYFEDAQNGITVLNNQKKYIYSLLH
jgi:hypothetical protein